MLKLCTVYKSPKKDEMYLYVDRKEGLSRVPEALLVMFGTPKEIMAMPVTKERKLARVDVDKLLQEITTKGFYLQMPPPKEDYLLDLFKDTSDKYKDL
jgi:uncharacterized protein